VTGGGLALEPFPRQTLVGIEAGQATYYSEAYNSVHWKSIAWWLECYGCIPTGAIANPVTVYLETSESIDGPWEQLDSHGAVEGTRYNGSVSDPASIVRVRIVVEAGFILTLAFRMLARWR